MLNSTDFLLISAIVTAFASVILLILTLVLIRHGLTLVKATNELAQTTGHLVKLQILPKLAVDNTNRNNSGELSVFLMNRGFAAAFDPHVYFKTGNSAEMEATKIGNRDNIGWESGASFNLGNVPKGGVVVLRMSFKDIEGVQHEESVSLAVSI